MQAIATLVLDDPYLKLTAQQRCDARRERRAKFASLRPPIAEVVSEIVDVTPFVEEVLAEPIVLPPLPPIPNDAILAAADIAFPRLRMSGKIRTIQLATLTEFPSFTIKDLFTRRRTADIVRVRQIAMYLAKTMTDSSLPEIGRRFGGYDHTTVIHAARRIAKLILTDFTLAEQLERIKLVVSQESFA